MKSFFKKSAFVTFVRQTYKKMIEGERKEKYAKAISCSYLSIFYIRLKRTVRALCLEFFTTLLMLKGNNNFRGEEKQNE